MGKEITAADAAADNSPTSHYEKTARLPDSVKWARESLILHQDNTNSDDEDAVADLLSDLMHYCDFHGLDFKDELRRATDNYAYDGSRE